MAIDLNFKLHPKQGQVITSGAAHVFYGGAAGGGKSHMQRVLAIVLCATIKNFNWFLLRRTMPEILSNHFDGPTSFYVMLKEAHDKGLVKFRHKDNSDPRIEFWNGSKIKLGYFNRDEHMLRYMGPEIHGLGIDEANQFKADWIKKLMGRMRVPKTMEIPKEWEGRIPFCFLSGNPLGVGLSYLKREFVDPVPESTVWTPPAKSEKGKPKPRIFIRALLDDNPDIGIDYEENLYNAGGESYVQALRFGSFDEPVGAFFKWRKEMVIEPFDIPNYWTRIQGYDHGYAKPFSVGWWAVADGEHPRKNPLPRGALVRYREWYGCLKGEDDKGLRLVPSEIADGIKEREGWKKKADGRYYPGQNPDNIVFRVADPAIDGKQGSKSVRTEFAEEDIYFQMGKNKRLDGWALVRKMMKGKYKDAPPLMYIFNTCRDFIRLMPSLPEDEIKREDLDTDAEDHIADETRYTCMSWEFVTEYTELEKEKVLKVNKRSTITYDDLDDDLDWVV